MVKTTLYSFVFAASTVFVSPAFAQENAGEWGVETTPRFWYMMFNQTPLSDSQFIQQTNETVEFPLYGFSIKGKPPGLVDSEFLLTAFRGSGSVKARAVSAGGDSARHVTDATRTDVEFLYRTRFSAPGGP